MMENNAMAAPFSNITTQLQGYEETQVPTMQILETEASKLPCNQMNKLHLQFGPQVQTFISP